MPGAKDRAERHALDPADHHCAPPAVTAHPVWRAAVVIYGGTTPQCTVTGPLLAALLRADLCLGTWVKDGQLQMHAWVERPDRAAIDGAKALDPNQRGRVLIWTDRDTFLREAGLTERARITASEIGTIWQRSGELSDFGRRIGMHPKTQSFLRKNGGSSLFAA